VDSKDIGRVNKICFLESDTGWNSIVCKHPSVIKAVTGTPTFRLAPGALGSRPAATDITVGNYYPSKNGAIYIPCGGDWFINVPLAGSAAATVCFWIYDCASPESAWLLYQTLSVGSDVNIARHGGTAQGGRDFGTVLTLGTQGTANVTATTSDALAANTSRRFLNLFNTGYNTVCYKFGANAVYGSGFVIPAGMGDRWDVSACVPTGRVAVICDTALTSTLAIVEGT